MAVVASWPAVFMDLSELQNRHGGAILEWIVRLLCGYAAMRLHLAPELCFARVRSSSVTCSSKTVKLLMNSFSLRDRAYAQCSV